MRCGLVTWLRACSTDAGDHTNEGRAQGREPSVTPELPGDLSQEITRILVNMFFNQTQETVP